jgi:pimeloyl-ACP methyl ester carboxylesterase
MRTTDIEAIGDLAGEALAAGGALVEEMHEAIASRPFGILGPPAAPVRVIHDGIAQATYAGVRGAMRLASRGAAAIAATGAGDDAPPLAETTAGSAALAAINGLYGDRIAQRGNPVALQMEVRRRGDAVTPRIVVFVHGLGESDQSWRRSRAHPRNRTYGERLEDELGYSWVELRYNTGLRISDNGRALARLLEDLVDGWQSDVREIALVGHSVGGLVARSACHYGEREHHRWTEHVRHVFCLGSPHLGADLEKGANVLGWALRRLPETRALGTLVNARSAGIKDLRFGSCVEEDWRDCDADEFLRDRCREVPFLADASYYFVAATVGDGALGALAGDLLVRVASASGHGDGNKRHIPFESDNGLELSGLNHFDLLNHPAVYEQLHRWLTARPRATPADEADDRSPA